MQHAPDLIVDGHAPKEELTAAIVSACHRLLPGWAGAAVDVRLLAGGISNALYAVSSPVGTAAFRIYGDNTERFIDRTRELEVMRLVYQHGFGPQASRHGCCAPVLHAPMSTAVSLRQPWSGSLESATNPKPAFESFLSIEHLQVLATFANGRIEEFLHMRSLQVGCTRTRTVAVRHAAVMLS